MDRVTTTLRLEPEGGGARWTRRLGRWGRYLLYPLYARPFVDYLFPPRSPDGLHWWDGCSWRPTWVREKGYWRLDGHARAIVTRRATRVEKAALWSAWSACLWPIASLLFLGWGRPDWLTSEPSTGRNALECEQGFASMCRQWEISGANYARDFAISFLPAMILLFVAGGLATWAHMQRQPTKRDTVLNAVGICMLLVGVQFSWLMGLPFLAMMDPPPPA